MALPTTNTTRLGSPGDIVVPFSDIAALLQSRLSDLELNNLLTQLIGTRTTLVQPGDLITAEWATDVLTRLARLEGSGIGDIGSPLGVRAVRTLLQAYDSYSTLLSRRSFMPDGTGADALNAALNLTTIMQNVLIIAAASTGPAQTSSADGLVDIFQRIYTAQKDLSALLSSAIPGVSDPQPRLVFAQQLRALLETNDGVTGALSLLNAINQRDAAAAVTAQDRINGIVTTTSGDRIIGRLDVTYRDSTRGETLVLNDAQPFGYIFRIANQTNRDLTLRLNADFLPPHEDWSASVTAVGGIGQSLTLRALDPLNSNDPATFRDVQINVSTPPGTASGDRGVLRLRVTAPAPASLTRDGSVTLQVGTTGTAPQPTRVRFVGAAPRVTAGRLNAASPSDPVEMQFITRFTTTTGATTRDFRLRVDATNPAAEVNLFSIGFIGDVPIDSVSSTATSKRSQSFQMTDQVERTVDLQVIPRSGSAGTSLNLTATIEAIADPTISESRTFTITAV